MGILFCFLLGSPIFAATLDRVVAKINNDVITLGTLEGRVAAFSSRMKVSDFVDEQLTKKELMKTVLDIMIAEKLQAQEAKKLGMVVTEETLQKALDDIYNDNNITSGQFEKMLKNEGGDLDAYKEIIRDQILVSRVAKMQVGAAVAVEERSIRKYYRKNKKDYWVPEKMMVSHIMFIKENGLSSKAMQLKRKEAEKILSRIQGGEEFSELAKKYSEDVSAHSGGQIGFVSRGTMMLEFENAAFSLKVGEVSKIVETVNGFHIIKCDNIILGYAKEYKLVRSEIERILSSKKREKKYQEWLGSLKKGSFIKISLFQGAKKTKKTRISDAGREKRNTRSPATKKPDRYSKNQNKTNHDEDLSSNQLIEKKLRNYKKLYTNGKISKETFLRKKRQLLEKL